MSLSTRDLDELEIKLDQSTPGPWFVNRLDDELSMSAMVISKCDPVLSPDQSPTEWEYQEIVAATLIQWPRLVDVSDDKWAENAELIVALRNCGPELVRLARLGLAQELEGKGHGSV